MADARRPVWQEAALQRMARPRDQRRGVRQDLGLAAREVRRAPYPQRFPHRGFSRIVGQPQVQDEAPPQKRIRPKAPSLC